MAADDHVSAEDGSSQPVEVDLDELIRQERKAFKYIDTQKKKRAKTSHVEGSHDLETICKDVPFDKQIGYSFLESLVEED